jgi:prepilin-type processing-associated H-X9-DG protein/prepilin-type N-terminal cleavage/methylation domain-containing protein
MQRNSKQGFSITELLVVISTVAILSAILFPVLAKVREDDKQTRCLNNLKQISTAVSMYAQDNGGWVTADNIPAKGASVKWSDALYKGGYLKSMDVTVCPSYPPYNWKSGNLTYGWRKEDKSLYPTYISQTDTNSSFLNLNKIAKPAQFIIIADSVGIVPGWITYHNQAYLFSLSGSTGSVIHLRHNGLANTVFADGHVAACDKAKIKQAALTELPPSTVIKVAEEDGTPVKINP